MKANISERSPTEATGIGFCSEHTAEYVLIPQLRALLEVAYPVVVPLFVWFTREGARGCSSLDRDRPVKLVAVFPRRPKVHATWQESIVVKFNEELFEYAACARTRGVPTLAGVPLASSIFQLTSACRAAWFALSPEHTYKDEFVRLELDRDHPRADVSGVTGPLADHELLAHIERNAKTTGWASGVAALREIRRSVKRAQYPWWAAGYKPFIMLLSDKTIDTPPA